MGSMYQLDSTVQDLTVSAAYDSLNEESLDPNIDPQRPIINIEYTIDTMTENNACRSPMVGAWVFDKEYGMEWTPVDGPVLGFLRIFAWYQMTIGRFSSVGRTIYAFRSFHDEIRLNMMLYTANNRYSITGHVNLMGDGNYLGCIATSRTPRLGESWTRGSDLSDGNYSRETWDRIIGDILSYELVERQGKRDKVWGLFPDDGPGRGHTLERRLGSMDVPVPGKPMPVLQPFNS